MTGAVVQAVDLVTMNASEDDKIKAMMDQSTRGFDASKYVLLLCLSNAAAAAAASYLNNQLMCTWPYVAFIGDHKHYSFEELESHNTFL